MNRLIFLAIACFLLLTPRYGFAAESLADCAAINNSNARLACFDKLAGASGQADTAPVAAVPAPAMPAASTQATPPAPVASTETAPIPVSAPITTSAAPATEPAPVTGVSSYQDIFGLENQAAVKGVKKISSRIINDFDGWDGRTVFRLENGQVWVQKDVNSTMSWRGSSHPIATIKRKAFNSYLLKVEGVNKSVRVNRVK
ncbi:MAG: hypothetical protein IIB68_10115 [Proteobacteria bacterium]|nr:hypothetical protein [Pseudomonadota bacterium]